MRDYKETLKWYRENQTTREIGFNPDNMCLKICRTARNIGPRFSSAVAAQNATPEAHRVHKVRDLRKGMVLYFDDVRDGNPYGHVATQIGRVPNFDPDSLHDILVETNSVKAGEIVVVRGDYFQRYWGDEFKFGATWLNGSVLDAPSAKPPKADNRTLVEQFRRSFPDWDVSLLDRAIQNRERQLQRYVDFIETSVASLPTDDDDSRVNKFVENFNTRRVLSLHLLNAAVNEGRTGVVRQVRNVLRTVIKSLPEK